MMRTHNLNILILVFGIITLCYGCQSDDESSDNLDIQTYWLTRYHANSFIGEEPILYDEQDILWTFDYDNNTLKVDILNDAEPILLDSGTYTNVIHYESSCDNGSRQLIINNVYYGHIFFNNNNQPPVLALEDWCFTSRSLLFQEI